MAREISVDLWWPEPVTTQVDVRLFAEKQVIMLHARALCVNCLMDRRV
jgi:hypothetical protein